MVVLFCLFGVLVIFFTVKGAMDIMSCVPYLPDRFDECKEKLILGLVEFLVPMGLILLMLYDLLTIGA